MLKIGDFSKLSRISIRMLRHYNEMELLVPKSIDDINGYRYYSEAQLPIANRITELKNMGFSLNMIKEILLQYNNPEKLEAYLKLKEKELTEESEILNQKISLLKNTLNRLGKEYTIMNYNVTLKELPERTVASVRKVIPSYNSESILWKILSSETAAQNI